MLVQVPLLQVEPQVKSPIVAAWGTAGPSWRGGATTWGGALLLFGSVSPSSSLTALARDCSNKGELCRSALAWWFRPVSQATPNEARAPMTRARTISRQVLLFMFVCLIGSGSGQGPEESRTPVHFFASAVQLLEIYASLALSASLHACNRCPASCQAVRLPMVLVSPF